MASYDPLDYLDKPLRPDAARPTPGSLPPVSEDLALIRELLPELAPSEPPLHEGRASRTYAAEFEGRPVVLRIYQTNPLDLMLGKRKDESYDPLALLDRVVEPLVGLQVEGVSAVLRIVGDMRARLVLEARAEGEAWTLPAKREEAVAEVLRLAQACARLHEQGAVHGGIHPRRVVASERGPQLVGAGWAAFTNSGHDRRHERGDPARYDGRTRAPEQFENRLEPAESWPPSPRADVFALACLAYEALVGQDPFLPSEFDAEPDDPDARAHQVWGCAFRRPYDFAEPPVTDPVSRVLERGLHPSEEHRFADAGAFLSALNDALTQPDPMAGRRRFPEIASSPERAPYPADLEKRVGESPESFLQGLPYTLGPRVHDFSAGCVWHGEAPDGPAAIRIYAPAEPPSPLYDIDCGRVLDRLLEGVEAVNAPGLARVLATTRAQDGARIVVERRVEGTPLETTDDPRTVIRAIAQAGRALGAAHAAGTAHGGVRPGRLLVDSDGATWLFGLGWGAFSVANLDYRLSSGYDPARLRRFAYRSPEQVAEFIPDARSDVFSLGAVLYELISGRPAFEGDSFLLLGHAIRTTTPDLAEVPAPCAPVLRRALAADPSARYADGNALAEALEEAVAAMGEGSAG